MPDDINEQTAALKKRGFMLLNSRRLEEARTLFAEITDLDPGDPEAWYILSSINGMLGMTDEAGECCRRVLDLRPDSGQAHVNMGNVLLSQGKVDEAAVSYQTAIQLNPQLSNAYFNLGNLRMRQERFDEAVRNYCQAILLGSADTQIKTMRDKGQFLIQMNRLQEAKALFTHLCRMHPEDVSAWYSLSIIHGSLGEINEAGDCCRRVLEIQPDHSGAHANLGNVLFHRRRFDEAFAQYERALDLDPQNITALYNMVKACQSDEHIAKYLEHYRKAIALNPNPDGARATFSELLEYIFSFPTEYVPWLDNELQECYAVTGIDHKPLGLISAHVLKLKYHIGSSVGDDADYLRNMIEHAAADKLFLMMLEKTINSDAELELLLTKLRRTLLLDYCRDKKLGPGASRLVLALAHQGLNNEHVFAADAEEEQRLADLRREIERSAPSLPVPDEGLEIKILVFGMYDRVSSLSCREHLCSFQPESWSETFRPFLMEALLNPLEEERIKNEIVSFGDINNQTSRLVQSQYDENPYPRWLAIAKRNNANLRQGLQSTFPHFIPPPFLDGPLQILAAGCGTGKQAIQAALSYSNVEILAVDITKSSLAYAMRMARKYGVENIKFMQADIQDLAGLERRFHIIDCIGVLHHMQDPLAGWKVLADLLVEDGLMQIGLYSELARKVVVEAREIIRNEALTPDTRTIRNFRARIIKRELGDRLYAMSRNGAVDFFSTSGCRDLLFHYHELRYTLPQLKQALQTLKLDFIGFKGFRNIKVAGLYRNYFPEDPDMTNLDLWHQFENRHPNTFGEMYHFWCQNRRKDA